MSTTTQTRRRKPLTRRQRWIMRAVLGLFSLVLALGTAEVGARILQLAPPVYPEAKTAIVLHYTDPNGLVKLTPGWEGYIGAELTTINEKGFRDRVFTAAPPPGVVRVAMLGDSYTMGDAAPLEASYPKQFESLLAGRHKVEVMNCGISATNTGNQLETLKEVVRDYHPHLVVLSYNVNDFQWYPETRFDRLKKAGYTYTIHEDGRVTSERTYTTFQKAKLAVRNHSYLYRWLANVWDSWVKKEHRESDYDHLARVKGWQESGGPEKSFAALRQIKQLCDQQGIALFVIVLPGLLDMPPSIRSMDDYPFAEEHEFIGQQLKAAEVEFIDLLPEFAGEDTRKLAAHVFERHYSQHGNAIIARALVKHVEPKIRELEKEVSGQ